MTGKIESRLTDLGIALPAAIAPVANYVPWARSGNLIHVSGQVCKGPDGFITGRIGDGLDLAAGAAAARAAGLALIAQVRAACDGDLDRVVRVVKLTAFVAATPDFTDHPKVVNGASDLMVEVFGEAGRHARSSVGVASLPLGVAVEIEGIFEVA